jgi:hypothetical protein
VEPKLVLEAMGKFESKILNAVAWLFGNRGGSVAYCYLNIEWPNKELDHIEVTINDVKRMHEEDEMNKQTEKETGE